MIAEPTTQFVERLGMIVGTALVACMVFTTVAPYFLAIPQNSIRLIDQQQTILQSVLMVLVGYLWGNSAGNKTKDSTIATLAQTAQTAGAALNQGDSMVIPADASATVTPTDTGAVIEKSPPGGTP